VARQAFIAVFQQWDGTGPQSALTQPLLEMAAVETPPELLKMLYSETLQPWYWARFAPLVVREAEQGDSVSLEILNEQFQGVVHSLVALIQNARLPDGTLICFSGGMVEGSPYYFSSIQEALRQRLPRFPAKISDREAYWGGWDLGKRILMGG
jgi:N-acetylglucosamine kinase-like BadF-type ATPase